MNTRDNIRFEIDEGIATIAFNRPEKLNALSRAMVAEAMDAFGEAFHDPAVRVIVLKGSGRAFCAGADLSPDGSTVAGAHSVPQDMSGIIGGVENWLSVWHGPKPVIAQVHGYCLGGGAHIASFCDLIAVADDARIGWPRLPVGGGFISPVWTWFVGARKAKELSFIVGSQMTGAAAVEQGWANFAFPAAELDKGVRTLARRIALVPADVLRTKKEAINQTLDVQGFSQTVRMTGAWDAIAHASPNVELIRQKIREVGLQQTIAWFDEGGLADTIKEIEGS